jgi:hypothetical protein
MWNFIRISLAVLEFFHAHRQKNEEILARAPQGCKRT